MRQLSRLLADDDVEIGATCLYACYDPRTRRCSFTSAGHPPPAVRHPDGRTEFVDVPHGMILGVQHDRYPTTQALLAPGSVLVLYTDGLVEQPGQDIDVGMSRLARTLAASRPARSLDDLRAALLASSGPASDDIALLLARTAAATGHDTGRGQASRLLGTERSRFTPRAGGWHG
jgi:serine phosphatase RsbU (regulator of sigma subunit)